MGIRSLTSGAGAYRPGPSRTGKGHNDRGCGHAPDSADALLTTAGNTTGNHDRLADLRVMGNSTPANQ